MLDEHVKRCEISRGRAQIAISFGTNASPHISILWTYDCVVSLTVLQACVNVFLAPLIVSMSVDDSRAVSRYVLESKIEVNATEQHPAESE